MYKTGFYFSQLPNRTCKKVYLEALKSIQAGEWILRVWNARLSVQELGQVLSALEYDYPETGRHAWNLVQIDGVYAYIDVTWDLKENREFVPHAWFGLSTSDCLRTRVPDQKYKSIHFPVCQEKYPMSYYRLTVGTLHPGQS